jgi:hypothetical protein
MARRGAGGFDVVGSMSPAEQESMWADFLKELKVLDPLKGVVKPTDQTTAGIVPDLPIEGE